MPDKIYVAIDLKSFYASVECAERKLDPLTTNLVVADRSRTEKTICLAVSPSLKAHGISGRARLFEVIQRVDEVNRERLKEAVRLGLAGKDENGRPRLASPSFDALALKANPALELGYITAPPRMRLYEEYSTRVFSIYLKYVSSEDIHVYSIDECFIDVTGYLQTYGQTARELAMSMIREVLFTTGITATAGIGTNLYLAKVAMDIVAKHTVPDKDGVRIAELDEISYRDILWTHRPLTDFWRIGFGYASRLESMGLYTMGDVARASLNRTAEDQLYKAFGINAELLIDHAWGWEPTEISMIKAYRPSTASLSSGQVLHEPYSIPKCRIIIQEMTEELVLDLVRKRLVTKQLVLNINYDRTSLDSGRYRGPVVRDHYGRLIPRHAHGTANLDRFTSSTKAVMKAVTDLYDRIADPDLFIRRVNIAAVGLIREEDIPEEAPVQLDLFTDYAAAEKEKEELKLREGKEKRLQQAMLDIRDRFGKNALLKGTNYQEGATMIERNQQIGGHKA